MRAVCGGPWCRYGRLALDLSLGTVCITPIRPVCPPRRRTGHLMTLPSEPAVPLSVELAPADANCDAAGGWRHNGALRGEGSSRLRSPAILRARGRRGRAERAAGAGSRDWAVGHGALHGGPAHCPTDRCVRITVDRGSRCSSERARRPGSVERGTGGIRTARRRRAHGWWMSCRRRSLDRSGRWSQPDLDVLGHEDALVRGGDREPHTETNTRVPTAGGTQAGDRHLNFHETRDNLI
jgi:hypothetical protein